MLPFLSLVSFFLLMARVTTHAGYKPGILFSTGSGDLSELGFSVTIALTTTLFPAWSFPRIRCTPSNGNIGYIPTFTGPDTRSNITLLAGFSFGFPPSFCRHLWFPSHCDTKGGGTLQVDCEADEVSPRNSSCGSTKTHPLIVQRPPMFLIFSHR